MFSHHPLQSDNSNNTDYTNENYIEYWPNNNTSSTPTNDSQSRSRVNADIIEFGRQWAPPSQVANDETNNNNNNCRQTILDTILPMNVEDLKCNGELIKGGVPLVLDPLMIGINENRKLCKSLIEIHFINLFRHRNSLFLVCGINLC